MVFAEPSDELLAADLDWRAGLETNVADEGLHVSKRG
jgi:hypothetical protein